MPTLRPDRLRPVVSLGTRSAVVTLLVSASPVLAAVQPQSTDAAVRAIASWTAVDAATGYEQRTSPALAEALGPEWRADRWGNVVRTVGSGEGVTVVACALDRPSYAVSQITDDGYLRVHRIGGGSRHDLWDQAFEAQQVRILTAEGPVAGVVARSNGHFAAQHRAETDVVGADDLWVDVGAASPAEVATQGIELLDPVQRHLPPWPMEGHAAGPSAGARTGCAAVVAAAAADPALLAGRTHFVLSAQEVFGWVGLGSYVTEVGDVDVVALVERGVDARMDEERPVASLGRVGEALAAAGVGRVHVLAPAVRQAGSHMEVVAVDEAEWLARRVAQVAGVGIPSGRPYRAEWTAAPPPTPFSEGPGDGPLVAPLSDLLETHATSDHEWSVRRYVLEHLPAWARERALVDDMGNVMVEMGPERDTTVFMAHMDEVGFRVESVASDGVVTLARGGGAVESAWEGQTALAQANAPGAPTTRTGDGSSVDPRWKAQSLDADAPPPLRGVFLTRAEADEKDPPGPMRAWFGMDAEGLAARGIGPGAQVTSHKEALRIGEHRMTGRSTDDRVGTTALLLAVQELDPDELPAKVIFTWSVYEEGGLNGAGALARRYAAGTTRIYSVDTFVSSDTPLESPHFAYAPLGAGPVLRAIENSSISPPSERERVRRVAAGHGIPLQLGLTQGGTDGTRFTFWGAPNQGLSWPGRYSHSPGEVLDLRDLAHLRDLIVALARTEPEAP